MPTVEAVSGSDTGSNSQRQETKYRPAASLDTVTVDGADGNSRLQRTSKDVLLFAIYGLPTVFECAGGQFSGLLMALTFECQVCGTPGEEVRKGGLLVA